MARISRWRQTCPNVLRELQYKVMSDCGLFLLRQIGPTAYTVQEENQKPVQVRLGDPHKCSCRIDTQELCLHICWVLLKILKLKSTNPFSFQLGLVTRELADCLEQHHNVQPVRKILRKKSNSEKPISVDRRPIRDLDSCPICLQLFSFKSIPVTFCKYSCGNAVHIRCMLQVAKHQLSSADVNTDRLLSCPLCRGVFGTGKELVEDSHRKPNLRLHKLSPLLSHDLTCTFCSTNPIVGNVYRCLMCPQVVVCPLCITCDDYQRLHFGHPYAVKKGLNDRWQAVQVQRPYTSQKILPKLKLSNIKKQTKTENNKLASYKEHRSDKKLVVNLHSECNDRWKETKQSDICRMPCLTPVPQHPTLRRQNAILHTQNEPPPEVRIIRMCLTKRTPDTDVKVQTIPRQCKYGSPSTSPTRMKSQKKTKKKKGHRKEAKETESSLPLSVTSGRALGAQVHPLMAVLMSPRTMTVSFNSDCSSGEEENEDMEKKITESRPPQLTITSLQLPDYASKHTFSHKNSLPPRRMRTSRVGSSSSCSSIASSSSTLIKDK